MIHCLSLLICVVGVAGAEGYQNSTQQTQRSGPPYYFSESEYTQYHWPIIMAQMSTIGPLPYGQAKSLGTNLSATARPSPEYSEPFRWIDRHFLTTGYGTLGFFHRFGSGDNRHRGTFSYSQLFLGLLDDQWLLQIEPKVDVLITSNPAKEFQLAYGSITYFAGDFLQLTGGKILNDFNISTNRLHPSWASESQDRTWASVFLPENTHGGKLTFSAPLTSIILGGSIFGGGEPTLAGSRLGLYFPDQATEIGASYATNKPLTDFEHTVGGYLTNRFYSLKTQAEVSRNISQSTTVYWAELSYGLSPISELLADFTPVIRWQEFRASDKSTTTRAISKTGGITLPIEDSKDLYYGLNYAVLEQNGYHIRAQLGFALAVAGQEGNRLTGDLNFKW